MQENRKQIIINEILYWKESHLLPEQYCNFLLALYTEGDGYSKEKRKRKRKPFYYLLLIPFSLLLILFYFTELSLILQMVFAIVFLIFGLYLVYLFAKNGLLYHIPIILSAFLLLFLSSQLALSFAIHKEKVLYIVLMGNCLVWWLAGWKWKQLYLTISGIVGLVLLLLLFFIDIPSILSL